MLSRRLIVALAALATTACATVGNGPMQRIEIDSKPAGARVRLYNCGAVATKTATTPATVWVSRRSTQCRVRVSIPGEEEHTTRLVRHVSRNMKGYLEVADVLCPDSGGCGSLYDFELAFVGATIAASGAAVDVATGSMFELAPSQIYVDFLRKPE